MKRCPVCMRDYADETLNFCLDDGAALLEGPASGDTPTAVLTSPLTSTEAPTRMMASDPSSAASVPIQRRSGFGMKAAAVAGVLFVLIGASYFVVIKPRAKSDSASGPIQIERLTTNARATSAAISPDGKYIAYGVDDGGGDSLWFRQVATGSSVPIFPRAEDVYYWGITFTPDSDYVNFVRAEFEKNIEWSLSQMSVLGGPQKKLLTNIEGGVTYSPDGTQLAFIRDEFPTADESALLIANADGSGARAVATLKEPRAFAARRAAPAWSPDGKKIVCIVGDRSSFVGRMDVIEIDVADGSMKPVITRDWKLLTDIAWLRDGSGILVLGAERSSSSYARQIWLFSYPAGEARRITTDFSDYQSISVPANSDSLATVQSTTMSNIWSVPNGDASRAVQIRSAGNSDDGMGGIASVPDGRVVFYSRASGKDDIWIMNADGTDARQLTPGVGANYAPAVSPDGSLVVFSSERDGRVNIWRVGLDGGEPVQLTTSNADHTATVSPDSRWVVYVSEVAGHPYLMRVSIDGGEATRISDGWAHAPRISPDGKWIVSSYRKDENTTWRYAITPFDGGEPIKVFDLLGKKSNFRWSPDGKSLYYLRDTKGGVTNVWSYPVEAGEPRQITDFKTENIFDFDWSADGKTLVLARGTTNNDIVLIRNFR